ncbi:ribokinase [Halopseudomonas xinjiangensis]|uniref:Ribokinase n=1 Tax=Halopseudomonas xinjiangensis TaxID=487184 RepID=A0A1H1MUG8_9GAMM|nr:PfkB family carbohydrate kinase [Halopseudomonas xinjiangensis]SDR90278.1 ribokinase [Halopseudomonas xinjiangensis]
MQQSTLLSLGSINADFQVRIDQAPGSTETLLAHEFRRFAGGKASNTAWLGALFDHESWLLGRVGDDDLAEQALAPLREAGIDVSAVTRAAGQHTGVSMITVPPDAKKHIVLATNANDDWDEEAALAVVKAVEQARLPACLVADCEVPAWVVQRAVEAASRRSIPVVLDPSFPDRVEPNLLGGLLAITPNESEAEGLLGRAIDSLDDAAQAAHELRQAGVRIVCLKLSDGGCLLDAGKGAMHIPAGEAEPVDTTGAGDCFTGVLAIALLEGREPIEAAAWAVAASNAAVTTYGSKPAYPTRDAVAPVVDGLMRKARRVDG